MTPTQLQKAAQAIRDLADVFNHKIEFVLDILYNSAVIVKASARDRIEEILESE